MEKFETFSEEDLAKLHELQSRQKRVNRQRKMIISAIDDDPELKKQVIDHLNHYDRLSIIAKTYGTDSDSLFEILNSTEQAKAFRAMRQHEEEISSENDENVDIEDDDFSQAANNDGESQNNYY